MCKGNVGGFNIFLCNKCGTLYCQNCALTLSDLKNLCWFCNEPIDESKPVQPYKLEEEEIKKRLEKSEKSK